MYYKHMKALNILLVLSTIGCTQNSTVVPEKTVYSKPLYSKNETVCSAKPVVVAVIDTGLSVNSFTSNAKLCKFGHKDFTKLGQLAKFKNIENLVPIDNHGHGTNIAGLIQEHAGNANFCMVILKYYDPKTENGDNLNNTVKAIQYAKNIGVDYINYSGGGTEPSDIERKAVKDFLNTGGKFVAAAGNERADTDISPYYPALDDPRVISVGSLGLDGNRASYSNWGKSIKRWEYGTNQTGFGITLSGTSQAAAVATGKMVNESKCNK